jgi:TATA-box binding protein (TBP) (component of TFIID and TFIIIB)
MRDYKDIKVSTQTYIIRTDINHLDLSKCYQRIKLNNSIRSVKYKENIKGGEIIVKKILSVHKNFLNCLTIVINIDKKMNVKIFSNGTFQLTGCKNNQHVINCMNIILTEFIREKCLDKEFITYYIISVMRNIDFDVHFKIDRNKFADYIDASTEFCVPPLTTGYMGMKIKIPLVNINDVLIPVIIWKPHENSIKSFVTYKNFYTNIHKDNKKFGKKYYVSISVFQNGKILMSGLNEDIMESWYYWFISLIDVSKKEIELIPEIKKTFIRPRML